MKSPANGLSFFARERLPWLGCFAFLSVLAAAITSLFVARDAFSFGIIETLVMVTLVVGVAVIAVGSTIRREI